jgi:hypothetical protein
MVQFDPKERPIGRVALSPQELLSRRRAGGGSNHGGWHDPKATGLAGGSNLYLRGLWQQLMQWLSGGPPIQGPYRTPPRPLPPSKAPR